PTTTACLPMGVDMVTTSGRRPLIHIDDWDFNWQGFYWFRTPVALPVASWIELTAARDNSSLNPRNPTRLLALEGRHDLCREALELLEDHRLRRAHRLTDVDDLEAGVLVLDLHELLG